MKIISLKAMNCQHVEFLLGLINAGSGWLVLVSVQLGLGSLVILPFSS